MAQVGRNDPCPCGSGKKFKNCCEQKSAVLRSSRLRQFLSGLVLLVLLAAVSVAYVQIEPESYKPTLPSSTPRQTQKPPIKTKSADQLPLGFRSTPAGTTDSARPLPDLKPLKDGEIPPELQKSIDSLKAAQKAKAKSASQEPGSGSGS